MHVEAIWKREVSYESKMMSPLPVINTTTSIVFVRFILINIFASSGHCTKLHAQVKFIKQAYCSRYSLLSRVILYASVL